MQRHVAVTLLLGVGAEDDDVVDDAVLLDHVVAVDDQRQNGAVGGVEVELGLKALRAAYLLNEFAEAVVRVFRREPLKEALAVERFFQLDARHAEARSQIVCRNREAVGAVRLAAQEQERVRRGTGNKRHLAFERHQPRDVLNGAVIVAGVIVGAQKEEPHEEICQRAVGLVKMHQPLGAVQTVNLGFL